MDNKPNIIFVFPDQMRASAMGCSGVENVITPNIDAFAQQGTRFTRAISNTPVCSPARASILSGLHTLTHQMVYNDVVMRTDIKSIAHSFNEVGYKCGYVGKWHLDCNDRGVFIPPGPRRQGFDDFWAACNCNHDYFDGYYYLNDNPEPVWTDGYEPIEQTNIAIDYINTKAQEDNPFCMFLSWGPPHCPYTEVPPKYKDMYPPESIELKPNAIGYANREHISGYYAHVTALDECFGRLLDTIKEAGIEDNTIVVFTSDHGDMLYSQNRGWKCKPWLEAVNIPFIIRWPGHVPEGRVSDGLISLVDVMPTLLSLVGVDIPEAVEGEDLAALILGDESASPESVFINIPVSPNKYFSYSEWRGVVTKTHTYARFRNRPWICYNDAEDPYQMRELRLDPDTVARMEGILQQWLKRTNDPFETTEEVCARYYKDAVEGIMPYYENEIILNEKARRAKLRAQKA